MIQQKEQQIIDSQNTKQSEIKMMRVASEKHNLMQYQQSNSVINYLQTHRYVNSKIVILLELCGRQVLNVGPDFHLFMPILLIKIVLTVIISAITYHLLENKKVFDVTLLVNVFQNLVYALIGFLDSGILVRNQKEQTVDQELAFCQKCNVYRKLTTYHCSKCEICIKGYDHHCIWIGKCVGSNNIVLFYMFVIVTPITIIYNILLVIVIIGSNHSQTLQ